MGVHTFLLIVGPGGLRAPLVVADGSEAGHFSLLLIIFFTASVRLRPPGPTLEPGVLLEHIHN